MSDSSGSQLRLRVFAGPNGSGKSTVIKLVRETLVNGRYLDFGLYVNADDILSALKSGKFFFSDYIALPAKQEILEFADSSGLLSDSFGCDRLERIFELNKGNLVLSDQDEGIELDRLAQIVARFLREKLLEERKRFSFETVFSHKSNLDIMRRAVEAGYKVYLYFVSTESPEINKYRVALRVREGGHNVSEDRIESRYYRSLGLLREASGLAHQAFFFDNSIDNEPYKLEGHFKKVGGEKKWDEVDETKLSNWFKKYGWEE